MKRLLLAAFAVFFVSGATAQEVTKPVCHTSEDILAVSANAGNPLPIKFIQVPEMPGIVIMVYEDGSGLLVKEDENGCVVGAAIMRPADMAQILPRLQSW